MIKLDSALKRELDLDGRAYILTLSPDGFTLVEKGRRKGFDLAWTALISGDAALAVALSASVANAPAPRAAKLTPDRER
ncbi:MAG TPA: hypothetical protein VNE58_16980 [Casimicrobiaceae bacterium]|nr:hypothetical protein [Casimicrobiaceae bacterium]